MAPALSDFSQIQGPGGFLGSTLKKAPLIGGFFGSDETPYSIVHPDEGTNRLLEKKAEMAGQSPSDLAQTYTKGIEGSQGILQSPEQSLRRSTSLGMTDNPAISEALQKRAQRSFNSDLNRIQQNALTQAPLDYAANLGMSTTALNQAQANEAGRFQRQVELRNNQLAARNQVLGSVLGLAGTAVGAFYGGPQGAAMGSQASGLAGPQKQNPVG